MGAFGQIFAGLNKDINTLTFAKFSNFFKNLPHIVQSAPKPAKYGYYSIFLGIFLLLLQLVLAMFG